MYLLTEAALKDEQKSESEELVQLNKVSKHYAQGGVTTQALREIDLVVSSGEMVAICGPSGSGKSTLLRIIGMLQNPSSGRVAIARLLVAKMSESARAELRREIIGLSFPFFVLLPMISALENVLLPLSFRTSKESATSNDRLWAVELLSRLDLGKQIDCLPGQLNFCQRKRVAIARTLVTDPRLALIDDLARDFGSRECQRIMDLFWWLQRRRNTTFVMTARDKKELDYGTRVVQLSKDQKFDGAATWQARSLRRKW